MAGKTTEADIAEAVRALTPFVNALSPLIQKFQENNAPIVKRAQYMNFIFMMTVCLSVGLLAFFKVIDGSATTGLLGAVIGYVFGSIYSQKTGKNG